VEGVKKVPKPKGNGKKSWYTHPMGQMQIPPSHIWLFRIVAVTIVPILTLLLLELTLRVAGYGYPARAIVKCRIDSCSYCCDNVKFSWCFFPARLARESGPFIFPVKKPSDTCRVFVLGSSAAMGTPDPAFCFGRMLRVMLLDAYPGANFEVIVTAMAAVNSHAVLEIAKDCAKYEPDLFIVYLGNNEVIGPYGAGTVFAPLSRSLSFIRLSIALRATRLGQLVTNLVEWVSPGSRKLSVWQGMEMFVARQISAGDPRLKIVNKHYQNNLRSICNVARKGGAKVILCTLGVNLKDSPPFASLHRSDLSDAEKRNWDQIYQQGGEYEKAGKHTEAVERYLAAEVIDDSFADLQFRLGRCYWFLERYEQARQRYLKARDLDTLRFRADTRINGIIRTVAGATATTGVYLVDAEELFAQASPHRTCGQELFYEHVHLNFVGNYLLAKITFEQMEKILPEKIQRRRANDHPLLSQVECAQRLAYTDWDRYRIEDEVFHGFVNREPFTNQLYHAERIRRMEGELLALKASMTPNVLEAAAAKYARAIQNDPEDWYLHWKYGKLLAEDLKNYGAAVEEFRAFLRFLPHSYIGYDALASALRALGDLDGAIAHYEKTIRIKPTCGRAHYYLGWAYQKQGKLDKAITHYFQAVYLQPDYVPAYNNLAEILYRQGKIDSAVQICRRGLRAVPGSAILHSNLGMLLDTQGHKEEALRELQRAIQLDPNSNDVRRVFNTIAGKRSGGL
jgi:tetratricopeptide (TPR) repeat protein